MSTKTLGVLGLFGAPWLYLGIQLEDSYPQLANSWFTGVWGLIYISGWICAIMAFRRLRLTGEGRMGRIVLVTLLASLMLANCSNLLQIFMDQKKPVWFFILDLFWPISNLLMIPLGMAVISGGVVRGAKKYVPLAVGVWLPLALLGLRFPPSVSMVFGGLYSAVMWSVMSLIVVSHRQEAMQKQFTSESTRQELAA